MPYGVFLEFPGKVCGLVPRRVGITFLTHLSLASLLWDIGKQNSPRCDAAEHFKPVNDLVFNSHVGFSSPSDGTINRGPVSI